MGDPFERWNREHAEKEGHYAGLAGFLADVRNAQRTEAFQELDLVDQISVFGVVVDLMREAHAAGIEQGRREAAEVCRTRSKKHQLIVFAEMHGEHYPNRSEAKMHEALDCALGIEELPAPARDPGTNDESPPPPKR